MPGVKGKTMFKGSVTWDKVMCTRGKSCANVKCDRHPKNVPSSQSGTEYTVKALYGTSICVENGGYQERVRLF